MLIANSNEVDTYANKSLLIAIIEINDNTKQIIPIDIFIVLFISQFSLKALRRGLFSDL